MSASAPAHPETLPIPIPIDLFLSKNQSGLRNGDVEVADSSGNILFQVTRSRSSFSSSKSSPYKMVVLDASGNALVSMFRQDDASWRGFKGDGNTDKDLIFRVKRTAKTLTRCEMEVHLVGGSSDGPESEFKVKGFAFQRSCTIFRGDSIVAQTSLMYKLHEFFKIVGRSKYRLTIFPGSVDGVLVVALIVIFFYGYKWRTK